MEETNANRAWTFLTHHGHVLVSLSRDPNLRLRDIAAAVGITERATATMVSELVAAGYLQRIKQGRRNHYRVDLSGGLRHPVASGVSVGAVFAALIPTARSTVAAGASTVGNLSPARTVGVR